jgi:hypothetical protein
MKALEALERAISLVTGRRAQDYGDAEASFQRIADGWNIIVRSADGDLTSAHVALMMDWMKSARLLQSINHADSWVDKAGYAGLGAQLAMREPERPPTAPSKANGKSVIGPNDMRPESRDYSQG